jgi:hypothetical protein
LLHEPFLNVSQQGGFPNASWTKDKDQQGSCRLADGIADRLVSLGKRWMSNGVGLEVVEPS